MTYSTFHRILRMGVKVGFKSVLTQESFVTDRAVKLVAFLLFSVYSLKNQKLMHGYHKTTTQLNLKLNQKLNSNVKKVHYNDNFI